jgi:hypothetical protein
MAIIRYGSWMAEDVFGTAVIHKVLFELRKGDSRFEDAGSETFART